MAEKSATGSGTPRILCPVRGTRRSEKTINRAIELALEGNACLSFLFILDLEFLGHATVAKIKLMTDELRETGLFVLDFVGARARRRGVEQVDTHVLEGTVDDVIPRAAADLEATTVVMGRPIRTPGVTNLSKRRIEDLVATLRETGYRVEYVE